MMSSCSDMVLSSAIVHILESSSTQEGILYLHRSSKQPCKKWKPATMACEQPFSIYNICMLPFALLHSMVSLNFSLVVKLPKKVENSPANWRPLLNPLLFVNHLLTSRINPTWAIWLAWPPWSMRKPPHWCFHAVWLKSGPIICHGGNLIMPKPTYFKNWKLLESHAN